MTYCLALKLRDGLVFASDSRTTAGVDYISTYRKMHVFQPSGDRLLVVLTSGNLATTQEVLDNLRRDLATAEPTENLATVTYVFEAARYVGRVLCTVVQHYASMLGSSGADLRATLIVGGQIRGQPPEIYLVYPEGNYVAATWETPYLQLGEFKYGKPILSRLAGGDLSLEDSVKLFEEGVQLSNACKKELEAAEGKIQLLVDHGRGEMVAKQLEVEGVRLDDEDNEDGE